MAGIFSLEKNVFFRRPKILLTTYYPVSSQLLLQLTHPSVVSLLNAERLPFIACKDCLECSVALHEPRDAFHSSILSVLIHFFFFYP